MAHMRVKDEDELIAELKELADPVCAEPLCPYLHMAGIIYCSMHMYGLDRASSEQIAAKNRLGVITRRRNRRDAKARERASRT